MSVDTSVYQSHCLSASSLEYHYSTRNSDVIITPDANIIRIYTENTWHFFPSRGESIFYEHLHSATADESDFMINAAKCYCSMPRTFYHPTELL